MKIILRLFVAIMLLVSLVSCTEKANSSPTGIVEEMSGVWRAKSGGALVSIIYSENKMRLLIGDDSIPISLGEVDNINKTANMNVMLKTGKPGVWTIRQIWDKEKTAFHLQLTLHDGTQDELSFVRKITTDDLNKIENAEARTTSGSIDDAAKEAGAIAAAAPPPPPEAQPMSPVPPTSLIVEPAAEHATIASNAPTPVTWAPSFDCSKASTKAELLICSSKDVSEADVKLARAYEESTKASADKASLKRAQLSWVRNERDTCEGVQCLLLAYQNRLIQLAR
jgi:uncharacterized protein YecT (DUF1311 family)